MGLNELVREIVAAGDGEGKQVRAKADAEAAAILAQARAEADAVHAKWTARARDDATGEERRILASAELEAKKLRLNAEAAVLQAVRDGVTKRIASFSPIERANLTRALLKGADVAAGGRAWARADDRQLAKELGFEPVDELKGLGGIVVEAPSGETREDLRFETVLDDAWRAVVRDVANDLFRK